MRYMSYVNTVDDLAENESIVEFFFVTDTSTQDYTTVSENAVYCANVSVEITSPAYNITETVNVSTGATALDVLNTSITQGIIDNFNYTWVEDYYKPGTYYAWLTDINGVPTYNWTETGYGYALVKDGVATDSLDQTVFTANSTYKIFMGASTYGGNYAGTSSNGYYTDGVTESLTLIVRIV